MVSSDDDAVSARVRQPPRHPLAVPIVVPAEGLAELRLLGEYDDGVGDEPQHAGVRGDRGRAGENSDARERDDHAEGHRTAHDRERAIGDESDGRRDRRQRLAASADGHRGPRDQLRPPANSAMTSNPQCFSFDGDSTVDAVDVSALLGELVP